MKKFFIVLVVISIGFGNSVMAQVAPKKMQDTQEYKNILKLQLTALTLRNYQIQYERIIGSKTSVALAVSHMPKGGFPYKDKIKDLISDNEDTQKLLDEGKISQFAITPEFRWYLGENAGKGFYMAPFYRYSQTKFENLSLTYENDFNIDEELYLDGDITGHSAGLLLGVNFNLGKRVVLDWWILGPHYGVSSGNVAGVSDVILSPTEQDRIQQELEDLDIPLIDETITVTENGAIVDFDGPWGGIRTGLSLGFRF